MSGHLEPGLKARIEMFGHGAGEKPAAWIVGYEQNLCRLQRPDNERIAPGRACDLAPGTLDEPCRVAVKMKRVGKAGDVVHRDCNGRSRGDGEERLFRRTGV